MTWITFVFAVALLFAPSLAVEHRWGPARVQPAEGGRGVCLWVAGAVLADRPGDPCVAIHPVVTSSAQPPRVHWLAADTILVTENVGQIPDRTSPTGVAMQKPPSVWPPPSEAVGSSNGPVFRHVVPIVRPLGQGRWEVARHLQVEDGAMAPLQLPVTPVARMAARHAPDLASMVLEIEIGDADDDGLVEEGWAVLTGRDIEAVLPGSAGTIDIARVQIAGGSARQLPLVLDTVVQEPSLPILPVQRIDHDGDGSLGPDDEIRFWAGATSGWVADTTLPDAPWRFVVHPHARTRTLLVRLDAPEPSPGLPFPTIPVEPMRRDTLVHLAHAERHIGLGNPEIGLTSEIDSRSGANWYWTLTTGGQRVEPNTLDDQGTRDLPGLVSPAGWLRHQLAEPDRAMGNAERERFEVNGQIGLPVVARGPLGIWSTSHLQASANSFAFDPQGRVLRLAGYTVVHHIRPVRREGGTLLFPPGVGAWDVPVADLDGSEFAVAVRDDGTPLRQVSLINGILRDSVTDRRTLWWIGRPDNFRRRQTSSLPGPGFRLLAFQPPAGERTEVSFVGSGSADVLVVVAEGQEEVARQYATFRSRATALRPMTARVVRVRDIYRLYSGGALDPLAVRAHLRWARSRLGITHVLFLGDAHYDPRSIREQEPVGVPTWPDRSVSTDDVLGYLDPGEFDGSGNRRTLDLAMGRVPSSTAAQAAGWLAKLRMFEQEGVLDAGSWRNRHVLVADDLRVRSKGLGIDGSGDPIYGHTTQLERIAASMLWRRAWLDQRKIYLVEYPLNAVGEKPEALRDLVAELQGGALSMTYMGHGSSQILADERVFEAGRALRELRNIRRPFFLVVGSCTVGRFDDPTEQGLAEALVLATGLGAHGAIAATRPSYPGPNEQLINLFWNNMLEIRDVPRTLGEALQEAKNTTGHRLIDNVYDNRELYHLLGDPALVLTPGGKSTTLEGVPDTLGALDPLRARGRILPADREGRTKLRLSTDTLTRAASYTPPGHGIALSVQYTIPGRILSTSETRADPEWEVEALVPARLDFGALARVTAYTWDPVTGRDGGTVRDSVVLWGTGDSIPDDTYGPQISLVPCDSSFSAGTPLQGTVTVPLPFCLEARFSDPRGIAADNGPDEGVQFHLPGVRNPWHPELRPGASFQQASALLVLSEDEFEPGQELTWDILAHDLMGNPSTARLGLRFQQSQELSLVQAFARPNPARDAPVEFVLQISADPDSNGTLPREVDAAIRVHSQGGTLVRVLRTALSDPLREPRPTAFWDLRDAHGNEVANGIYPWTAIVRLRRADGRWAVREERGVVVVARRFTDSQ